ncbi:immunoglobulin superfamily member 6 isoform X1 [Microtus ochrogaster]|uniref:immunoglobulin superfamily member 6 isoform X1 n=1 Tax=Microtus ochrogaster TaxID=79684 RepID=UPI00038BE9D5|nr:immunoglobulin superfamily member 6 isoform X1 [Microtus ochrogaster]
MPSTCRVMGPVSTSKIGLPLEISLILFHVGVVGACTVSVVQPRYLEVDYTSETVTLECTFSTTGCSSKQPRSLWFRCGAHQPEALCLDGCRNKADKFTVEETLDQNRVSLTVNRVSPNDSAVYICGIAFPHEPGPRAKQTGSGTALVIREGLLSREVHSLLIVIIALFSVYIAGVCVIFIVLFRSKSNSSRSRETKEDSQKKSARRIFREIAQELYHKRYVETCQQPERDGTYENRRALPTPGRP